VIAPEPSQSALGEARGPVAFGRMSCAVLIRIDSEGEPVVMVGDDAEPLPGGDGVRYRFVAEVDSEAEAARIADAEWHRRRPPLNPETEARLLARYGVDGLRELLDGTASRWPVA
jgi:hypothetical protein